MSYYHPQILTEIPGPLSDPVIEQTDGPASTVFSITPYELMTDELTQTLLLFDFPSDIIIYIDNTAIPSSTFDYLNPLLVDPPSVGSSHVTGEKTLRYGKILFYRGDDPVSPTKINCYTITMDLPDTIIQSVLHSTVHYPPNYYIDYSTVTVSRASRSRQLCDLLEQLREQPPGLPGMIVTGMFMQSLGASPTPERGEILETMIQPELIRAIRSLSGLFDSDPPRWGTTILFDPTGLEDASSELVSSDEDYGSD